MFFYYLTTLILEIILLQPFHSNIKQMLLPVTFFPTLNELLLWLLKLSKKCSLYLHKLLFLHIQVHVICNKFIYIWKIFLFFSLSLLSVNSGDRGDEFKILHVVCMLYMSSLFS